MANKNYSDLPHGQNDKADPSSEQNKATNKLSDAGNLGATKIDPKEEIRLNTLKMNNAWHDMAFNIDPAQKDAKTQAWQNLKDLVEQEKAAQDKKAQDDFSNVLQNRSKNGMNPDASMKTPAETMQAQTEDQAKILNNTPYSPENSTQVPQDTRRGTGADQSMNQPGDQSTVQSTDHSKNTGGRADSRKTPFQYGGENTNAGSNAQLQNQAGQPNRSNESIQYPGMGNPNDSQNANAGNNDGFRRDRHDNPTGSPMDRPQPQIRELFFQDGREFGYQKAGGNGAVFDNQGQRIAEVSYNPNARGIPLFIKDSNGIEHKIGVIPMAGGYQQRPYGRGPGLIGSLENLAGRGMGMGGMGMGSIGRGGFGSMIMNGIERATMNNRGYGNYYNQNQNYGYNPGFNNW